MSIQPIGLNKFELDTPCLTVDINVLKTNLKTMQQHGLENNIHIRPHCKTHKCSKLAELQIEYGAIGVCAAKISEAEILIHHGIPNLLITSPIVAPNKISRLINCIEISPNTMVVVDNEQNIIALSKAAELIKKKINVLVDLNSGIGRTGVNYDCALDFAFKISKLKWLNLVGIQCYAGNLQHITSFTERKIASLQIMKSASEMMIKFKKHGLPCYILTGTGTGTYDIDIEATEITEIQPGSYTLMDVEYSKIGSKNNSESFTEFGHAMTLLTTVISNNQQTHVTVDAGTKSIYVDNNHQPKIISHNGLQYDWGGFGDEHGKITTINNSALPNIGDVLELVVPHCDPTINLFDKFFITEYDKVIDIWDIDLRGKSQ